MYNTNKLGKIKETILIGRLLKGSILALAVFLLAFTIVPALITEASAADWIGGEVDWGSVFLTLDPDKDVTDAAITAAGGNELTPEQRQAVIDTELAKADHGDINFGTITPTARTDSNAGTMMVKKKTIGVTTTGKYYTIYLSTSSSNNNLNLVQTIDGQTTTHTEHNIPAINGSWSSVAKMTDTTHPTASWGFAVPGTTIATADETPSTPVFPIPQLTDTQIYYTSEGSAAAQTYNDTRWAAVPASGTPQQIWKNTTNEVTGFNDGDSFDVYYGILIDTDVLAGTYENSVVYTALASASSLDRVSTNVMHDKSFGGKGDEVNIAFDLTDSTASVTKNMVTVAMVPHSTMISKWDSISSAYELDSLDYDSYDQCLVTNLTRPESKQYIELSCVVPDNLEGSEFDFWIKVSGYNYDYVSRDKTNGGDVYASYIYAGLQTKYASTDPRYNAQAADPNDNLIVKNMQEMTNGICNLTNAWGNTTSVDSRVYDYTGGGNPIANTAVDSDALGVGTFALTDIRDNKDYLVRRLADGNCWMVQNLDLELADFAGHNLENTQDKNKVLTPANTDITELGTGYYDPTEITNAKINGSVTAQDGGLSPSQSMNISGNLTAENKNFVGLAKYMLGTTVDTTEQFQSFDLAGANHFWGSKCTATTTDGVITSTTCDSAATAANTILSEIPRSYSNMVTSDNSTDFNKATQFRYVATNWETGQTRTQTMDVTTGYPTAAPSAFGTGATDATTATATYIPTTKASSATGSAGAGYESATNGSYYGTMYVGHYYNWYAATAESGAFSDSKTYDASICPAGWRLPQNGDTTTNYSWSKLIQGTYGLINKEGDQTASGANPSQGTAYGPSADMHKLPLSIPFTGNYNWQNGNLNNRGTGGLFWSSTVNGTTSARSLYFTSTDVYPQSNRSRVFGFTVRCVAHGTELNSTASQEAVATTCSGGKICYDGNGGTGSMTDQSASANASVVLTAPTYTRLGYSFAGWSTQDNGFGTVYGPNETITTPSNLASTGLQLYAKWLPSTGTMQSFTTEQCTALGEHQSIALTDNRDGNTYTVTKLKDGNCWMTTNLALNLADFAGDNPKSGYLTTENTDIGNDKDGSGNPTRTDLIDLPSTGGGNSSLYRWDPSKSMYDRAVSIVQSDPTKLPAGDTAVNMSNYFKIVSLERLGVEQSAQFQSNGQFTQSGDNYPTWTWYSRLNESGEELLNDESNASGGQTETGSVLGYIMENNSRTEMPRSYKLAADYEGFFYNYYAATAESAKFNIYNANEKDSICPSGWDMPVSGSVESYDTTAQNGSWRHLIIDSYGITQAYAVRNYPLNTTVSGYYSGVGGGIGAPQVDLWTAYSTVYSQYGIRKGTRASHFYAGTGTTLNTTGINSKANGYAVRCVMITGE